MGCALWGIPGGVLWEVWVRDHHRTLGLSGISDLRPPGVRSLVQTLGVGGLQAGAGAEQRCGVWEETMF